MVLSFTHLSVGTCSLSVLNLWIPEWWVGLWTYLVLRPTSDCLCRGRSSFLLHQSNNKQRRGSVAHDRLNQSRGLMLWSSRALLKSLDFTTRTIWRPFSPGERSRWGQAEWSAAGKVQRTEVSAPGSTDRKWPGSLEVIKPLIWYHRERTHSTGSHRLSCTRSRQLFSL